MRRWLILLFLAALCSGQSMAEDDEHPLAIPDLKKLRSMNGINPAPYDRFWDKWRLVTTRYRSDNGEQRFIYANDIAFKAMQDGVDEFPDGSVFGKVAFTTRGDPQFPNSKEPVKYTRLQLMVKNKRAFRKLDGWSYYIHLANGSDNAAEDSENAMACHACHTIVKDRDFIFAGPTFMQNLADWFQQPGRQFRDHFRTRRYEELIPFEKNVLELLSKKPKVIKSYRMRLFAGSLYESIGPLTEFSKDGMVYALIDPVKKRFLVAENMGSSSECKNLVHIYKDKKITKKKGRRKSTVDVVSKGIVCNGVNRWVDSFPTPANLK